MARRHRTLCPRCRKVVLVTTTAANARLLVQPKPNPAAGNTAVMQDQFGVLRSRRVTTEEPALPWEKVYRPHVATCGQPAEDDETPRPDDEAHADGGPGVRPALPLHLPASPQPSLFRLRLDDYRRRRRRS